MEVIRIVRPNHITGEKRVCLTCTTAEVYAAMIHDTQFRNALASSHDAKITFD